MVLTSRREILEQVARGGLTPDQAAELLARLDVEAAMGGGAAPPGAAANSGEQQADADAGAAAGAGPAAGTRASPDASAGPDQDGGPGQTAVPLHGSAGPADTTADPAARGRAAGGGPADTAGSADTPAGIAKVRLRSTCRAVTVIGDPDVHTAVVDGEHTATVEGDAFVIHAILDHPPGFSFLRTPGGPGLRARVRLGGEAIRPLVVRMNPRLGFDGEIDAGSMTVRGVQGPIRGQVSAGALRVDDFDGPIDLKVAAGAATARGRIDHGVSRIECDAGKVTLRLTHDSSVAVHGRVNLGQLSAPDMVGDGDGTLEVVASLGGVEITVEELV